MNKEITIRAEEDNGEWISLGKYMIDPCEDGGGMIEIPSDVREVEPGWDLAISIKISPGEKRVFVTFFQQASMNGIWVENWQRWLSPSLVVRLTIL